MNRIVRKNRKTQTKAIKNKTVAYLKVGLEYENVKEFDYAVTNSDLHICLEAIQLEKRNRFKKKKLFEVE